ncbi:hypothetical protein O0L34_g6015 [Tuta absoluta]|nr:hypothetical protein O0L34_g6015 [Tuta absoluta]
MECQKCKKVLSKNGSHFMCKGPCQGTFHRACVKGLAADLKAGKNRIHCNNCEVEESEEDDDDVQIKDSQDNDKILRDIQRKCNGITSLKKQLQEIKLSMNLLSDKYDTLLAEHDKSKEKNFALEKTVDNVSNKCIYLEKCNLALQQTLQGYEQSTRKHNLEIVGVEQLPDENVKEIVTKIGGLIDVSSDDIEWVRRNQPRKQGTKAPTITVGFKNSGTESRDAWLAKRRKLADVTSKMITSGNNDDKVYINEDLSKSIRTLLWNTKKKLHGVYRFTWVINGKVLVKKAEGDKAVWVRSEADINALLKVK